MNMLKAGNRLNLEKNDEEIQTMSKTLRQKLSSLLSEQNDEKLLQVKGLPKIPRQYQFPLVQSLEKGKNMPICTNDAHNKATNNGFKRNALGGFFAH